MFRLQTMAVAPAPCQQGSHIKHLRAPQSSNRIFLYGNTCDKMTDWKLAATGTIMTAKDSCVSLKRLWFVM